MKNVFFATCLVACSLFANAAPEIAQPPLVDQDSSSSCPNFGGRVYGEFLYMQPTATNFYYGASAIGLNPNIAVPVVNANWTILEVRPGYAPGFRVGMAYLWDHLNLDINLNWQRLYSNTNASFETSPAAGYMVGPIFDIGPSADPYKIATGQVTSHFDLIGLDFGRTFLFKDDIRYSYFTGISCGRIKQTLQASYSNMDNTISKASNSPSTFEGIGPLLGLSYGCKIFKTYLSLNGTSTLSFLMGDLKNSTTYTTYTPELTALGVSQPNVQTVTVPTRQQLVPAYEQKLGLSFSNQWNCVTAHLDIGYQCQVYWNAIQTIDLTAPEVIPSGAIFSPQVGFYAVGFERTISNYLLSGLYVTAGIDF